MISFGRLRVPGSWRAVGALGVIGTVVGALGLPVHAQSFVRRDVNADGSYDISDAVFSLSALFVVGSSAPSCFDAADANDDGVFDISDAVYTLSALFVPGSPPPPAPHPGCGVDPTADALGCATSPPGCPGTGPLPFISRILGLTSGVAIERTDIIRDAAEFAALWDEHFSIFGAPPPPVPAIDFATTMVIVITRPGSPPSNYYWITGVEVLSGSEVQVTYQHQVPNPFCATEPTPVPIHVVSCPTAPGTLVAIENLSFDCFAPF